MTPQNRWKRSRNWLKALRAWLSEASYILTAVLIAFVIIWFLSSSETTIRWAGMILQLLGIGTVILGIEETRRLFGRPNTIASSWHWLKRFPPFGGRTITASIHATRSGRSASGRGYMPAKIDPNASIESRVEILEKNIERLHERISTTESEMDSRFRTQKQELEAEKNSRESEDRKVLAKLEATELGGVHISAMGAIWLFFGVILSSIPKELSVLFN